MPTCKKHKFNYSHGEECEACAESKHRSLTTPMRVDRSRPHPHYHDEYDRIRAQEAAK
jgi:hypothetical protein